MNMNPDQGAVMAKTSTVAIFGGSGAAVMSASPPEWLGLTPGEWQIVGIIGGILVGLAGLALNAFFKWKHFQLAKEQADFKPGLSD